jgi:uncharacterized membrane protein YdbT with pleckstrin-like domain
MRSTFTDEGVRRDMGYVETVLQPDETLRFRTNYHWIALVPGSALLVLAIISYWWAGRPNTWYGLWMALAVLLVAGAVILLLRAGYRHFITEIAITDRRVIYKTGLMSRETDEMPLNKVENVEVRQSILGRLLDYGDVDVQGTGRGGIGPEKLRRIASPPQFRNHTLAG